MDLLSTATSLSKTAIKDCLNKGGVWLRRHTKKEQRIRKAKLLLQPRDRIGVYYDETILALTAPEAECLFHNKYFSVWNKPAGLLSQGTRYGDHCSLLRLVQKMGDVPTPFLVHRLDREAQGLVLLAHSSSAAARLSELFRNGKIEKRYKALVTGLLGQENETMVIDAALDDKQARTSVTILQHHLETRQTKLDITLHTGRYHQIRRHLSDIGHPLVGDRRYGRASETDPLQLTAYSLSFRCPFAGTMHRFDLG